MIRLIISIILSLSLSLALIAQDPEDSVKHDTPFRKGRIYFGMNGMVSSSSIGGGSTSENEKFTNSYALELNTAMFVADRWLVGLGIGAQRANSETLVVRETEVLYVGPQARFFIARKGDASLYPMVSLYYSRYFERFQDFLALNPVDEELIGDGVGGNLGLGFAYVLKDLLVFDLRLTFNQVWYNGRKRDFTQDITTKEWFNRSDIVFGFGFAVLLDTFTKE